MAIVINRRAKAKSGRKLVAADYADGNPVRIAQFFLGKVLCVQAADGYAEGMITETEAYGGVEDAACHAHLNRRTERTRIMYEAGGVAYVYLCYGLHHLFNIITGPKDSPEAVLVRAVRIIAGHDVVRRRRCGRAEKDWASGPGRVSSALAIGLHHYGHDLSGEAVWIEDRGTKVPKKEITAGPRIGIDYAGEWAKVPWRFVWKESYRNLRNSSMEKPLAKARGERMESDQASSSGTDDSHHKTGSA